MGLLDLFRRRPAIASIVELEDFLDSRAAFIVQKSVFEYSRARAGLLSAKLFKEAAFKAALDQSRWRNYPLCLQNVALMVEHTLRAHAGEEAPAMRQGLIAAVANVTGRYPVPPGFDAQFWVEARQAIGRRIDQAGLAAPHPIKDIPKENVKAFFAALPFHKEVRRHDFELITNNLRVNLCRAYEDFLAAADLPALAGALIAGPAPIALPGLARHDAER